ncbi:MAG: LPS assembly lipoprotein LptE [Myxococcota bacterium]|nr:LPS assembly lipoprotein LptE [Myxococcota bacterium]
MIRPFVLLLSLLACSCGYRFTAGGADLPEGVRKVCAPLYVNRTAEAGLELVFTESLRAHLIRAGTLGSDCQAQLNGEVVAVWGGPTVITNRGVLASYRIFARVQLRLTKADKLLAQTEVTGWEDYLPSAETQQDVLRVEANRQAALRRLSDALAREAYEKLTTAW